MHLIEALWFLSELTGDYLGTYQRSWTWLKSLNDADDTRLDYLKSKLLAEALVGEDSRENLMLLEKGRDELVNKFPLLVWRKHVWDGKWRVVMYDIPENHRGSRNTLRRWLRRFGFGQWQMSVWVSPHPVTDGVDELLEKCGLRDYCSVHVSQRITGVSDPEFAERIWKLKEINGKYGKILEDFHKNKKTEYLKLLMSDPMLPKELLPVDWLWDKVMERMMQI